MSNMDEKIPIFGKGMRNTGGTGLKNDSKSKFMGKRSGDGGGKGRPTLPGKTQPVNPIQPIKPPVLPGKPTLPGNPVFNPGGGQSVPKKKP